MSNHFELTIFHDLFLLIDINLILIIFGFLDFMFTYKKQLHGFFI